MKVQFKATAALAEYHGFDDSKEVDLLDGEKINVSEAKAKQLLSDFPDNFSLVKTKDIKKAKDRMIRNSKTK